MVLQPPAAQGGGNRPQTLQAANTGRGAGGQHRACQIQPQGCDGGRGGSEGWRTTAELPSPGSPESPHSEKQGSLSWVTRQWRHGEIQTLFPGHPASEWGRDWSKNTRQSTPEPGSKPPPRSHPDPGLLHENTAPGSFPASPPWVGGLSPAPCPHCHPSLSGISLSGPWFLHLSQEMTTLSLPSAAWWGTQ